METVKEKDTQLPEISILMAVYEPRMDWLRIQLNSLNAQTYSNLRLYIRDDCSPKTLFTEIQAMVAECITAFPYTLVRNEKNLGSNGTFERLTQEGEGDLFAYCDQDDEWLPEKLTVLQEEMARTGALLACSDMFVMDGNGKTVADSITKVRRHHVFRSGTGLAPKLLFSNFVTGCTMLVDARAAKAAVPFCPYLVHDQYLALWCAEQGRITPVMRPLICYRIHGGNQTVMMAGVTDKKSYGEVRIALTLTRFLWLREYFSCGAATCQVLEDGIVWAQARQQSWNHQGGGRMVWKYRKLNPLVSVAELCLKYVPEGLFMAAISLARGNKV